MARESRKPSPNPVPAKPENQNRSRKSERQRQMEDALWKTAQRFKALIENSSDMVVILDEGGIFRYSSLSLTNVLGYPSEHLIGRSIFELIHPDDVLRVRRTVEQSLQTPGQELPEIEYQIRHYDGTWRTVAAVTKNLLQNPVINGLLVNCHDVTQRTHIEEALRHSVELFSRVISSISDHIYVTQVTPNGEHKNIYISPHIEELTGYPLKIFMADRNFWPNHLIHPNDRTAAAAQSARLENGESCEMEYRLVKADGTIIWVRDSGRVVDDGATRTIYGVVSNVTQRIELEKQLRQSQKMESVGRLAGGIAHDFNNLLTVIIGNSELILNDLSPDNPLRKDINQINQAATRAAAVTRQLLAFSRNLIIQPQILNLNDIIKNTDHIIQRLVGNKISLDIELATESCFIRADAGQMEQVIINLVVNAVDAMPEGGRLTINTANVKLDDAEARQLIEVRPGSYVRLTIKDTGLSMDEDTKNRIFEPFFSTKEHGQGLGLATVHGIVSQSNGNIQVESQSVIGTSFLVYLPRVSSP